MAGPSTKPMFDNIENFAGLTDEHRAMQLLDAELRKENMDNMALYGVTGAFWQRRDAAAVRAIVTALQEGRK